MAIVLMLGMCGKSNTFLGIRYLENLAHVFPSLISLNLFVVFSYRIPFPIYLKVSA